MINSAQFNGTAVNEEKGRKNPGISAVIDWLASQGDRQGSCYLQAAGLVDLPPALLGRAHPDGLLHQAWLEPGARGPAAGPAAGRRGMEADRRIPAETASHLEADHLPGLRRTGRARDRYDGHVHVLVVVSPALPVPPL